MENVFDVVAASVKFQESSSHNQSGDSVPHTETLKTDSGMDFSEDKKD